MIELLSDYTFQVVLLGTMAIGLVSGSLGCFAYLRKQSLIGDVVAHSTLFGIMLFFLGCYWITGEGSKSLWVLMPGAIFSGVLALVVARILSASGSVREDSSLGVMLAIFFGAGLLLLQWVQRGKPIPGRRGLDSYLFGMAASMTQSDLAMIFSLGLAALILMTLFWKELKLFTFDPLLCHTLGFRLRQMDVLLIVLLVVGIVIGVQSVGVILMVALLITPAAAARQWSKSLGGMVFLSALMGAGCCGFGTVLSVVFGGLPPGPVIVLTSIAMLVVSVLIAPNRGVLVTRLASKSDSNSGGVESCR